MERQKSVKLATKTTKISLFSPAFAYIKVMMNTPFFQNDARCVKQKRSLMYKKPFNFLQSFSS